MNNNRNVESCDHSNKQKQNSNKIGLHSSQSINKFYIKYEQPQIKSKPKIYSSKRYSLKQQPKPKLKLINAIGMQALKSTEMKSSEAKKRIPSYLRPTQSSSKMQKIKAASNANLQNHQKTTALNKLRSKSLQRQQLQLQKQYSRVPIQYYDEREGKCAQYIRGRIIYRGYMPKNTHFFLKSLKPLKRTIKNHKNPQNSNIPQHTRNQHQLKFDSRFQSGNLAAVVRITSNEYWLFMRQDTNTHGLRQWYYFLVTTRKAIKAKFRIYKFSKYYSLYRQGMKPYIRVCNSRTNYQPNEWQQGGQSIKYQYDQQLRCFYLQFTYQFEQQGQNIQFSMLPPYTYSMLQSYLDNLVTQNQQEAQDSQQDKFFRKNQQPYPRIIQNKGYHLKIDILGYSLAGLEIPYIEIIQFKNKVSRQNQYHKKEAIIILSRTHPGETVSNFALQNLIDRILMLPQVLSRFDFYIVPMINPDGVFMGNHRTSAIGQDLNRNFHLKDLQAVHSLIIKVRKMQRIHYILDLHGHSARKNIFAYGDDHEIGCKAYLHTRILPKLISEEISSFRYDFCVFRECKQKKNTARVYYTKKYNINCLTFQQSYGLIDGGKIGINNWRNFGTAIANSLLEYSKLYYQSEDKQNALANYLCEQIEKQKIALQLKILKQKKMLGLLQQNSNKNQNMNKNKQLNQSERVRKLNKQKIEKDYDNERKTNKQQRIINNSSLSINIQQIQLQQQKKCQKNILNYSQPEQQRENQKQQQQLSISEDKDNISVKSSELSSGDDDLQLKNDQLEIIKKQVVKVGCQKQAIKRQKYNIADAKLDLFESPRSIHQTRQHQSQNAMIYTGNYHSSKILEYKSTAIPRIVKLQNKKKEEYHSIIKRFDYQKQKQILSILQRQRQRDERRMSIQQKFQKRVELPSISFANKK